MDYIAILRLQLEEMGTTLVTALPSLAIALIILLLTWVVARFAARIADLLVGRRDIRTNLKRPLDTVVRLSVWLLGFMLAGVVVMPSLTPAGILAGVGVGAVAIGLAFRGIFENYLAGVLIMVRDKMQVGDYVECKGVVGKLEHLGLRESHIAALSGETVIMPNAVLFKNPVSILTDNDHRRLELTISVGLGTDLDRAADVVRRAMHKTVGNDQERRIEVHAQALNPASVDFIVRWWSGATPKAQGESRDRAIRAVTRALGEAGISAPMGDAGISSQLPSRPVSRMGRTAE